MATPQQQQQQQQARQLRAALVANQLPPPTTTWLLAVINDHNHHHQQQPQQRTTPAPTLLAAATARLLAADLTAPGLLDAAATPSGPATAAAGTTTESRFVFPAHLVSKAATATQETRLPHDVVVQVRDVENLAQSRWQQVQALEAIARGEQTRGRTVVRLPVGGGDDDDGGGDGEQERLEEGRRPPGAAAAGTTTTTTGNPTHRLVLEDAAGQSLYALELVRCPLHAAWVDTRLARLRAAAQDAAAG
ncbi:mediated genome instability protein rmi1 [Niveomyces insectorum RCEF 264]|uniref:Mediated genome instability protein rmi1 n=1 Tax=Niveomyces insectorum RCEF 264 TaxID=1081102 RepID=A0A162MDB6_9HYPO|nr:mediated genome instability protein rmi1 [Niveomyces insectorum RCEF 264]